MIQTKLSTLSISYSNENINQVKTQLPTMSQNESWMMCESLAHADDRRELEGGGGSYDKIIYNTSEDLKLRG